MENRTLTSIEKSVIEGEVIEALRQVYDPEIPVNVYDLGLIYEIKVNDDRTVEIKMTLTTPMCPVAEILPVQAEEAIRDNTSVKDVKIELTWDPPFSLDMVSDEVKMQLGLIW
jgi:FeS assembly SUF system protein